MELRKASGQPVIFGRVSLDTVHIKAGKWKYLVVARDDLSGWIEAVGLEKLLARKIAQRFQDTWIYRFGAPWTVSVDGGSEFGKQFQDTLKSFGITVKVTTPYYPIVLFADRISTKRTTGYSPFELVLGQSPVLPVDLEYETYLGINWSKVKTTEELLEARTRQLELRDIKLQKAHEELMDTRQNSVDYWNRKKKTRDQDQDPGTRRLLLIGRIGWDRGNFSRISGGLYF